MVLAMAGRASVLAWDVPANREEPWRRFLQELSGPRHEEYTESRLRLGISAEFTWFVPRRSGGGVAVVYLEAQDPGWVLDRALREFAASDNPFDSWYRTQIHELFGCDFARSPRVLGGELLFGWREAPDGAEQGLPEGS
jgi:hypothetical protein